MKISVHGIPATERESAEAALRSAINAALKKPEELVFEHTDPPTEEIWISVPHLNGELQVSDVEFVTLVGSAARRFAHGKPVECRMQGGLPSWRQLW